MNYITNVPTNPNNLILPWKSQHQIFAKKHRRTAWEKKRLINYVLYLFMSDSKKCTENMCGD